MPVDVEGAARRKGQAPGAGLDYTGIAVELARYAEAGKPIDWNDIAMKCGSASVASVRSNWYKFKKSYQIVPLAKPGTGGGKSKAKSTEDGSLKPKPAKVEKPKTNRAENGRKGKAAAAKAGAMSNEADESNLEADEMVEDDGGIDIIKAEEVQGFQV